MEEFTRNHYEVCFEREYLKKRATEFQNFFCDIMELRYPSDFLRTVPSGSIGDLKNDGYLASKRMLFQLYAPKAMTKSVASKKIREDFEGAKIHWLEYFDTWVLVHGEREGLPTQVSQLLLQLKDARPPDVTWWGYAELRDVVFQLDTFGLAKLFGYMPTRETMLHIGHQELLPVIDFLRKNPAKQPNSPIVPVPEDKLDKNNLPVYIQGYLINGMERSEMVERFFREYWQPTLGDELAQTFTTQYSLLKARGLSPSEIFFELQVFAGGNALPTIENQAAIQTILAYFFEKCDIFERP